jgi:hypothetical protein
LWLGLTAAVGFTKYLPKMHEKKHCQTGSAFFFVQRKPPAVPVVPKSFSYA